MEEKDPIENKFNTTFSGYEQEPPSRVWDNISGKLHPGVKHAGFLARILAFSFFRNKPILFFLTIGGISVSLLFTGVYFGFKNHPTIRGHAYAGEARLNRGSAELFQVADKVMPWDSVTHYRSAIIDNFGHFQFSRVGAGNYLLRIAPEESSEAAKNFLPSWFDRYATSDSCTRITLGNKDVNAEVHLVQSEKKKN